MILPDDKDPSVSYQISQKLKRFFKNNQFQIIWDEQNKKWINKDQDEDEKESFKPPPKMTDLSTLTQLPNDINKIPDIPNFDQVSQMQSYGSPAMLSVPNVKDISNMNCSSDPLSTVLPSNSLQSNMFKMQRNKSK